MKKEIMDLLIELALAKRDAAKAKDALAAEEAAPALVAARTKARNTADLMKYLEGAVKEAWKKNQPVLYMAAVRP